MADNTLNLLNSDELLCLANCLRVGGNCYWQDDALFINRVGVARQFVKALELKVIKELDTRPNDFDYPETWSLSPSLTDMSTEAISALPKKEVLCFSNCIKATLECHDEEGLFHTHVGVSIDFARVLETALAQTLQTRS